MARRKHHHKSKYNKVEAKKKRHDEKLDHKRSRSPHFTHLADYNPGKTPHLEYLALDDYNVSNSRKSRHPLFLDDLPDVKMNGYQPLDVSYLLQQNADKRGRLPPHWKRKAQA